MGPEKMFGEITGAYCPEMPQRSAGAVCAWATGATSNTVNNAAKKSSARTVLAPRTICLQMFILPSCQLSPTATATTPVPDLHQLQTYAAPQAQRISSVRGKVSSPHFVGRHSYRKSAGGLAPRAGPRTKVLPGCVKVFAANLKFL